MPYKFYGDWSFNSRGHITYCWLKWRSLCASTVQSFMIKEPKCAITLPKKMNTFKNSLMLRKYEDMRKRRWRRRRQRRDKKRRRRKRRKKENEQQTKTKWKKEVDFFNAWKEKENKGESHEHVHKRTLKDSLNDSTIYSEMVQRKDPS